LLHRITTSRILHVETVGALAHDQAAYLWSVDDVVGCLRVSGGLRAVVPEHQFVQPYTPHLHLGPVPAPWKAPNAPERFLHHFTSYIMRAVDLCQCHDAKTARYPCRDRADYVHYSCIPVASQAVPDGEEHRTLGNVLADVVLRPSISGRQRPPQAPVALSSPPYLSRPIRMPRRPMADVCFYLYHPNSNS